MDDKEWVKLYVQQTHDRFVAIEKKIDSLLAFKWQALGVLLILVPLISFVFALAEKKGWL